MNRLCCTIISLAFSFVVIAQSDTISLPEVVVTATKGSLYATGNQKQSYDRDFLVKNGINNLADLVSRHSALFINSQGPGLLQTPSARGTGSGHTAVVWNGFNIQNNMNGIVDFSLVPLNNFEQIDIEYGAAGALYGSGAIGSTIYLNSQKKIEAGWQGNIGSTIGSFGKYGQQGQIRFGANRMVSSLAANHSIAENDFEYIYNSQKRKQSNSTFQQWAVHQDNGFQVAPNQFIKTFLWYQNNRREIAPSALESNSDAFQEDRAFRSGLEWILFKNKVTTRVRSALLNEYLLFESSQIEGSESKTRALIAEWETQYAFSQNRSINAGLHYTFDHADSNAFDDTKKRTRLALYANFKTAYRKQKGRLILSLRQEIADLEWIPLMPSLGIELKPSKRFQVKAKISRMYKLPNFNDLYWPELGNPDLLPESGWAGELNGTFQWKGLELSGTLFNSFIDDWILWAPVNGIWRPSNQRSVWARGISGNVLWKKTSGSFSFKSTFAYEYTRSTIRHKKGRPRPENTGKQLIYTPVHQSKAALQISYKNTRLHYRHLVTGKRFITTDNAQELPFFQTGDLILGQVFQAGKYHFHLSGTINNLWNSSYVVLPARPMPMRNYTLSLSFQF